MKKQRRLYKMAIVKDPIETGIKTKLRLTHGVLALLSLMVGQINFGCFEEVPTTKMIIIFGLIGLIMWAYYEDHKHKERTGDYPKGEDILAEIRKWIKHSTPTPAEPTPVEPEPTTAELLDELESLGVK
jgi:hypothetical protein